MSTDSSRSSQGLSSTVERDLAISIGIAGTLFAILLVFLLWWFCIRRKGANGANMNSITHPSQYHPVPTISGIGSVPLYDNSVSTSSDSPSTTSNYGLGIQRYGSIINFLPLAQIRSLIVTISNDLLSPSVMNPVLRGIVAYSTHCIRLNRRHHYRVIDKSITIFKHIFLLPR